MISVVICLVSLSFISCAIEQPREFGIYLADTGEVVLSDEHIAAYDSQEHTFELNEAGIEQWNSFHDYKDIPKMKDSLYGKEFVIKIGDDEVCRGVFWSMLSSMSRDDFIILDAVIDLNSEYNTISLSAGYPWGDSAAVQPPMEEVNSLLTEYFEESGRVVERKTGDFGIYMADTGEVVLSDEHIAAYDPQEYTFELNEAGTEQWNSLHDYEGDSLHGKEFVIRIGDDEVCQGVFWMMVTSMSRDDYVILNTVLDLDGENNIISLSAGYPRGDSAAVQPPMEEVNSRLTEYFGQSGRVVERKIGDFGIYLADTGELVLSGDHIEAYGVKNHAFELNEAGIERWNRILSEDNPLSHGLFNQDFVIKIGDDEICRGGFFSILSSAWAPDIAIWDAVMKLDYQRNKIYITADKAESDIFNKLEQFFGYFNIDNYNADQDFGIKVSHPDDFGLYLAESGELLISGSQIESYYPETYSFILNDSGITDWKAFQQDETKWTEGFVIRIGDREVGRGLFRLAVMSYIPPGLMITVDPSNELVDSYYRIRIWSGQSYSDGLSVLSAEIEKFLAPFGRVK